MPMHFIMSFGGSKIYKYKKIQIHSHTQGESEGARVKAHAHAQVKLKAHELKVLPISIGSKSEGEQVTTTQHIDHTPSQSAQADESSTEYLTLEAHEIDGTYCEHSRFWCTINEALRDIAHNRRHIRHIRS